MLVTGKVPLIPLLELRIKSQVVNLWVASDQPNLPAEDETPTLLRLSSM